MALQDYVVSRQVRENGFGGVDFARLERSIDQIAMTYEFRTRPRPQEIFDASYLPPISDRKF